jgi:hypothetical protein
MGKIGDGLDQAAQHVLTRKRPKSTSARVRFLVGKNRRKNPPGPVNTWINAEVRRHVVQRRRHANDQGLVPPTWIDPESD